MAVGKKVFILFVLDFVLSVKDRFHEEAFFKRLPTGHVYSYFQFTTQASIVENAGALHFNMFPKSLGQIIQKYHVAELHLSLTHGRWQHWMWGYPIVPAPHGAELWIWFSPHLSPESIDKLWSGVTNALSGQFCASLNYVEKQVSASPNVAFRPMGLWPMKNVNDSTHLRYAALPRENVCTENLTPWMKLLPCQNKAGMTTLFNTLHIYDASYHSLGIHLRSVCKDDACSSSTLELKQTFSSVFDPHISDLKEGWSFGKLFGEVLKSSCPLAESSRILIGVPDKSDQVTIVLDPAPTSFVNRTVDEKTFTYAVYDLKSQGFKDGVAVDVKASYRNLPVLGKINPPAVHTYRYTTGHGEPNGGIVSVIANEHESRDVTVSYLDVLPWYTPVFLHTLKMKINGQEVIPEYFKFIPAKDRIRPTVIEAVLLIPPKSTLRISFSFYRAYLKWTEHPSDSHHGFYIGSAVISTILPAATNITGISERCSTLSWNCIGRSPLFVRLHTESNLIVLPKPDFSMPYNVICLTCTIFAIGFGSMFNLATRQFVVVSNKNKPTLNEKIKNIFSRIFKLKSS